MTTGLSTSAIRRLTTALMALLIATLALSVIGANPAGAHRGPAHEHESSAGQASGSATQPRNQPTSSRVPPGAPTGAEQGPPRQNIPPVANDLGMLGGGAAVSPVHPVAAAAVLVVAGVKVVNDHLYTGYTGPSDRRGRNQPTSSRVPENAR